ncbi:uncharacterized protein LOC126666733 isoform X2 [Mercurialis annua]|uniref:uncharacterized protein LOC126666733 isoform X2 n=1 Tax=Mercurialis annua TaxID=3986 RepID=UPI00215FD111|nr:uncharacterized protein LOC126666733 isoform X2 [Mercurialis annua]
MGNEMGNNNSSGLQEENNNNSESQEKSMNEPVDANDLKGENYVVPTIEPKDYHQKETGLSSDDQRAGGDNPEVHSFVESPKSENNFDEQDGKESEIQPADSLEKELEDHAKQIMSDLEENVVDMNNSLIDEQSFFNTANDPESNDFMEQISDQPELMKVSSDGLEQGSINSRKTEDMAGSSIECNGEENGDLLDTYTSDRLEATVVSRANSDVGEDRDEVLLKELASQDRFEVEVDVANEKNLSQTTTASSDHSADVNIEDKASKVNGTELIISVPEDRFTVLTQEFELSDKGSTCADSMHDDYQLVREPEFEKENASQPQSSHLNPFITHVVASDEKCQDDKEIKVLEDSDNQNGVSKECCENSERNVLKVIKIVKNSDNQNRVSIKCCENFAINDNKNDERIKVVADSYDQNIVSEICCEKSERNVLKVDEEIKVVEDYVKQNGVSEECCENSAINVNKVDEEIKVVENCVNQNGVSEKYCEKSERNVLKVDEEIKVVEDSNKQNRVSEECSEKSERNVLKVDEEIKVVENSDNHNGVSEECYQKSERDVLKVDEELKVLEDSNNQNTVFEECCDKSERNAIQDDELEMLEAISSTVDEKNSEGRLECCKLDACVAPDEAINGNSQVEEAEAVEQSDNRYEASEEMILMKDPEFRALPAELIVRNVINGEEISKGNPQELCSSDIFTATDFSFHAIETAISNVESAMEKPEAPVATEMVTETNLSASAHNSSEQHQKFDMPIFESDGFQAQETAVSHHTEPVPEKKFQAEVTEANSSESTVQISDRCEKVETPVLIDGGFEPQEVSGRFRTESNPDNLIANAEIRKSQSFDFDLRFATNRTEEFEKTPLLFQDKNTIEEKVIPAEKTDSNRSKLDKKKEITAPPSKSKEKQKRRSSLFANCMCCTTVIN